MKTKKFLGVLLAALILLSVFPLSTNAYSKEQATLTFTDSGITETVSGSGYNISGNTLTITASGTYRVTGGCSEGNITVGKELTGVTLILDDLSLTSATTAPIIVKKGSSVLLKLEGESTLTDNEDASTEATNSDFEGAAIKVKSGSTLKVFGDGILNAAGNAKNAIKGASESSLTVDGGTINVSAVNNGIAFDGSVVINAGTFNVTSDNDGIKSQPDEGDNASSGTVTINGGTFNINASGDGIVAAEKLTINNGTFDIKTLDGSQSSSFNKDTMSCKGLKASSNNVTDAENPTTSIIISGGTFNLNTADDAIHSDGYVTITGGTFDIYTGDDGVHADVTLTLGTENGYDRDPEITINSLPTTVSTPRAAAPTELRVSRDRIPSRLLSRDREAPTKAVPGREDPVRAALIPEDSRTRATTTIRSTSTAETYMLTAQATASIPTGRLTSSAEISPFYQCRAVATIRLLTPTGLSTSTARRYLPRARAEWA